MATITIEMTVGATTATETITATDTRALQFLDDLRNLHFVETPTLTRNQAGTRYLQGLKSGVLMFARGLEQRRLDAAVATGTDLEGN